MSKSLFLSFRVLVYQDAKLEFLYSKQYANNYDVCRCFRALDFNAKNG